MTSGLSFKHWHNSWHICIYTLTYSQSDFTPQRHRGTGSCYLSWVGVCWKMCFSYSLSHQPQQTGLLSVQLFTGARDNRLSALSSFHLSLCPSSPLSLFLQACICFIAFPSFPHAIAVIFPFPPTSFSCTFLHFSSFTGSSPAFGLSLPFSFCLISSVLSNGSLGSFPHTVCLFPFLVFSIQH